MIVDVIHPGRPNVPKDELSEVVGGMHKADAKLTVMFGFRTKFGGGKSTGFCLIYDNEDALRKFEPKHRLWVFVEALQTRGGPASFTEVSSW